MTLWCSKTRLQSWHFLSWWPRLTGGVCLCALILFLSGCNTSAIYQDNLYNPPVYWGRHVVQQGDTMYSVAWRYGRNYKELAAANHIPPPYNIYPGEVIRLDVRASSSQIASNDSDRSNPAGSRSQSAEKSPRPQEKTSSRNITLQTKHYTAAHIRWQWPHVGPIIAQYSLSGHVNKGIDIAGQLGDPVHAAADGEVVYAGSGLLGYGELVIINHNEHYLSAYAHNSKILVKEGERIRAGQVIARMGATGAKRVELHFEIRRDGQPVNPERYLPPRK